MRVVDITHDVIYKYYKKLSGMKKVSTIYTSKPNIKEIFKARGLSKRVQNCCIFVEKSNLGIIS